ncbi:GNAT family N-acetyltransferase [Fodinicola acaciae]|uniref:GNAT family N-acetyltransferase n=1 Tax=Fodinicola acaciae TaxID=2681555 RepID=UPI0013D09E45|nr:GNAT family N-acetyltransferase [Fodinicola acaciae]
MTPDPTDRLSFRQMTDADLDDMATLFADPAVMRYYPRTKTREEAQGWIDWSKRLYRDEGFGLWILTLRSGEFIGDCGLTVQVVEGVREIEVGYHVRADLQGNGYATEAAAACRDHAAKALGVRRLVAIIHPDNVPSQRVAEKIGLSYERALTYKNWPVRIYGAALSPGDQSV